MKLKQLFADEDAVSPVIGVILMVAITVILAAVIGTFVLGLGDNVSSAPQANFQFTYDDGGDGFSGGTNDVVSITHNGGDDIESSQVSVVGSGSTDLSAVGSWPTIISTGDANDYENVNSAETVRIVWEDPAGGSSSTIGSSTAPN